MRRAAALAALLLALSGCGEDASEDTNSNEVDSVDVVLPDGRTVTCLTFVDYNAGGIDCDWEGAR